MTEIKLDAFTLSGEETENGIAVTGFNLPYSAPSLKLCSGLGTQ